MAISAADLPLNPDGSVYHLNLLPNEIADTVILVGDPRRAIQIAERFEKIETKKQKRELISYTGLINKKHLTVIGTGMGIGNIDIVINELDALVNIDLKKREIKKQLTSLNIIRLGTAGALHKTEKINTFVVSEMALGFDNLLDFYDYKNTANESAILKAAKKHFSPFEVTKNIYTAEANGELVSLFSDIAKIGFTLTASGFYGPQYRHVRAPLLVPNFLDCARHFSFEKKHILNLEMETAAIYGLGRLLGHRCCSVSAIIANRANNTFSDDPYEIINRLIDLALERVV